MIAHIVIAEFTPTVDDRDIQRFHQELGAMRVRLGGLLRQYVHGPGLGLRPGVRGYGITAVVDSVEALDAYLDDEDHLRIGAHYGPLLFSELRSVQVRVD